MVYRSHALFAVILIASESINGHYFPPGNTRYFSENNAWAHNSAVRTGDLASESRVPQGSAPCRNKDANKQHKDNLWWTLPIPPMELDDQPEKPQPIKTPEQQVVVEKSQYGAENAVCQPKHIEISSTIRAATVTSAAQLASTTRHESSPAVSALSSKQDHAKVSQVQKQAQASAPPPSQQVVSNRENGNQLLISNKSVATLRTPIAGKNMSPGQHSSGKQRAQFQNIMDPAEIQYSPELSETVNENNPWLKSPYYNVPFPSAAQMDTKSGLISNVPRNSLQGLSDTNLYRDFDNTETEIGGGTFVGDNTGFNSEPQLIHGSMEELLNPQISPYYSSRNRRNSPNDLNSKNIAIS